MSRATAFLGWLVFITSIVMNVVNYRVRWEFGRYGMPRSLIGPTGTYRDGTVPDPLSRTLAESGFEEEVHLLLAFACLMLTLVLIREMLRLGHRLSEQNRALRRPISSVHRSSNDANA